MKTTQEIPEQKESEQQVFQVTIKSSQQLQGNTLNQKLTTVITNEINDQKSDLGQYVRDEIIKQAAFSFVEELRALNQLLASKKQTQSKQQSIALNTKSHQEQSSDQSSDEQSDSQSDEVNSHPSRQQKIRRILCSDSDDESSSILDDDSDEYSSSYPESQNSFFTFQAKQQTSICIPLENREQKNTQFEDILLQGGSGKKQGKAQKSETFSQILGLNQLRKKLRHKVFLIKNSSGPKFNSLFLKEQKQQEQKQEKKQNKDTKGVRKLQKMIEKLKIDENRKEEQNKSEFSTKRHEEDNESDDSYQSSYQEGNESQNEEEKENLQKDLLALKLDTQQDKNVNNEQNRKRSKNSGAMKKVKVQESENYSRKPIYIKVQFDVVDYLQNIIRQNREQLEIVNSHIQAIKEIEASNQGNDDWS